MCCSFLNELLHTILYLKKLRYNLKEQSEGSEIHALDPGPLILNHFLTSHNIAHLKFVANIFKIFCCAQK